MKKMVENSKTARKRFENGSETARKWLVNVGRFLAVLLVLLTIGIGNAWGTVLFHETFGDNSGSARVWDDSYSVKSGVTAVYSGISSYTMSNLKQSKNTIGSTKSGLIQTTKGTDAYIIIGPLNVASYNSLGLTYQWKAASIKETYTTKLYYATSSGGSYTEVSGTGTGANDFVERSYSLPAAAQVSTLYLKIVWNTSNTQAVIDEVDLTGTAAAPAYSVTWSINPVAGGSLSTTSGVSTTVTPNSAYTYGSPAYTVTSGTATVSQSTNTFTATPSADCSIRINMVEKPKYTVTLMDDGDTRTQASYGASVTLPSRTGCTGYTFAGWTKSWVTAQTSWTSTAPTIISAGSYTPSANENLYPVYTKTEGGGSATASSDNISSTSTSAQTLETGKPITYKCSSSNTYSDPARIYKNSTLTIAGGTITSISLTGVEDYAVSNMEVNTGTLTTDGNDGSWSGSATSVVFTASSAQTRISAISVTYTGGSTTYYISVPNCCTPLGSIGGAVEFTDPTTAVLTWNNIDHVSSWSVSCEESGGSSAGSVGSITTNGAGKKTCTITGLSCDTDYDFTISPTPASGYCDKDTTLEDKNSGKWDLDYTFSGAALKDGDLDEGTGVLCGDLDITIEPLSLAYELPSDVTVTIGGNSKTKGTDYTWDSSTGELHIDGEDIDGAVAISCTASLVGCLADPSIGAVSLKTGGTFNLGQVDVTVATSGTGSATCAWTDYGFVWSESANPTVSGSGCTKVAVGSDGSATTWNGSLTKTSFATGTTYYYRAYGKNSKDDADFVYSSSDGTFTPRSVAFNSNGGSSVDTKYVNSGTATSAPSAPTKTGYTFDSWRTTSGLTTAMDFSGTITKDTTLYAKWTANEYTVTISKNYGAAATKNYTATYDADMPDMSDFASFTRKGYTLTGIFANNDGTGTKYYNADKSSAHVWDQAQDKTIYAAWSPNSYTITLNNHDADTGHEGTDKIAVTYDSNTNLSGTPAITVPEKDGYVFFGYYTAEDGGGSQIIDADGNVVASVSNYTSATKQWIKAGDVTLHAYWKQVYTVTWYVDGEEWSSGVVTGNTSVVAGEKVSVLPTAPTKANCDDSKQFIGWRGTTISGSTDSKPAGLFTTQGTSPAITGDTTFYAVFANVTGGDVIELTFPDDNYESNGVGSYSDSWTATSGTYSWSIENFNNNNWNNSWAYIKCGHDKTAYVGKITTSSALPIRVDSVFITIDAITAANLNSAKLQISSASTFATTTDMNITQSTGTQKLAIASPAKDKYYRIAFDCKAVSKGCVQISKVVYKQKLDTAGYVTTCAECNSAPSFNATYAAVSEIGCDSAIVTATGGLASLGSGDGCHIREYGFVWGTSSTPTLKTNTGKYTVSDEIDEDVAFNCEIEDLTIGTQYYVRAYAINKHDTAYTAAQSFYTQGVSTVAITQAPAKTKYIAGETFDPAGMEITATMASGDEVDVTADVTYSESALTSGTNQDFDITYSLCDVDKEVTQTIDVYTLTVKEGTNPSYGEVSASGALITATPTSGNIGVPTVTSDNAELRDNNDNTYTVINPTGDVSVTINYREAGPTVVHYYVNGVEITSLKATPTEGSSFDLPNASAVATAIAAQSVSSPDPTNYPNFWGWSRTPVHPQSTTPDVLSGSTKVYTETSFYAVYTNMSKIRIDETVITATTYVTSETDLTAGGLTNGFKYIYVMKENKTGATDLQFKKGYGYIYNQTSISNLKHVDIGLGGESRIDVFACSAANEKSGSALSDADTRTDAYVYMMPASTSYFLVEADNLYTYYIDYIDIYYGSGEELYMTTFKNVFNPTAASGNWSSTANWEDGVLPNIHEEVWIKKPVTVNVTDAQAKSIVIDQSSGNTGSITIPAGKALVVAETVKKTTDGETLSATEVADLHIGSSSTGNGSLVMGSHDGTNKAQVDFYTKARKTAENNWVNQYIGTPFNVADGRGVKEDYYGSYLYSFDFDTQSWVNIKDEDYHFTPFLGYNIIRKDADAATLEMQGTLVATTNQSPTVYYKTDKAHSENVLANSWTAPIKIANFDATPSTGDFTNVEATIYIFNAGGEKDYEDNGASTGELPGQYRTYSVGTAGTAVIPSMQSFSVYATAAAPSLTLNYARLVYNPAVEGIAVQPNYAPRRMKAAAVSEEMQPIRLRVSGESGYADELKIYLHEDFSDAFENGWDAHKMYGYPETPQLYAVTDDGELAILCAPDADATLLGFKAGEADTEYTFTFRYDSDEPLFLLDMQNNTYTEVQTGNAYTFQTSDVGAHNRFVLTRFAPQTPTDIEPTSDSSLKGREAATKLMIDNRIYILLRGVLYDATGKRVRVTNERVNE